MKHFLQRNIAVCTRVVIYAVVGLLTLTTASFADDSFQANVDYAVFFNAETGYYVEVYYEFNKSGLALAESQENSSPGEALVAIRIIQNDSFVVNDLWRMQVEKQDSTESERLLDVVRYKILPGDYMLKFYVQNMQQRSKSDSIVVELEIEPESETDFFISDIELSTSIKKAAAGEESNFIKNTLEVIPNPGRIYGEERPILFYYAEAYNLLSGIKGEKYQTYCWITDSENNEIADSRMIKRSKMKRHDTSVEVGTFNVSSLSSGAYNFNFAVGEIDSEEKITRSKKIYIYNKSQILAKQREKRMETLIAQSEFGQMDMAQLDEQFEFMQYLLNDDGKKFYQQLDNKDAKRRFIHSFWKSNDPTPDTAINEFREQYFGRMDYANDEFGRLRKEGWKTDRGRVYLIYGIPDDRDRYPSSSDTHPYEIWEYNSYEGGVIFVFVDAGGFREYVLVHSTATGEVHNENWEESRAAAFR